MMNVKDKYSSDRMGDEFRFPWTLGCDSFKQLNEICDVISACAWKGGRTRAMNLTKMTAFTFIITTKTNINAGYHLLTEMKFSYIYKQFVQTKFWKSYLAKRGKEVGVTFTLTSGVS